MKQPNKLGWITSLTYNFDYGYQDVTAYSDKQPQFIKGNSILRGSMDFMATDAAALHEFMQELSRGSISSPVFQKEFMCLYCGSPNNIENTHCKKCGAPRSFLIG